MPFARSPSRPIPVAETHAGGLAAVPPPAVAGRRRRSGTLAANQVAPEADLVIGIGTRFTDFPTASKTAFQDPGVRFVNINVAEFDAFKHAAILLGDARATLEELAVAVGDYQTDDAYRARVAALNHEWDAEVERVYHRSVGDILTQGEVIGAVEASSPSRRRHRVGRSLPGDLLKLWRSRDVSSYQVEYGYSTMGYEIAGGGRQAARARPRGHVMVGDGSFQMMSNEITTAVQEGLKLIVVVVDNKGFPSAASPSRWAPRASAATTVSAARPVRTTAPRSSSTS